MLAFVFLCAYVPAPVFADSTNLADWVESLIRSGIVPPQNAAIARNAVPAYLSLTNPTSALIKGTETVISWNGRGIVGKLSLHLNQKNGQTVRVIANKDIDPSFGQYHWLVEEGLADGLYQFVLFDENNTVTRSQFFTIAPGPKVNAGAVITLPNGGKGSFFMRGSTHLIEWNSFLNDSSMVSLSLIDQKGIETLIMVGPNKNGKNSFEWSIPREQPIGKYKVRLVRDGSVLDESDNWFDIYPAYPVVTQVVPAVASPGSSVTLTGGGFSQTTNIVYVKNASTNYPLKPISQSDSKITFTLPQWLHGSYQVSVERDYLLEGNAIDFVVR